MAPDRLGQMRDDHRLAVDDGIAESFCLALGAIVDPDCRKSEGRLDRRDPRQAFDRVAGVHRQAMARNHLAARHLAAAHLHHVFVRVERGVVVDANRGDHDSEVGRDLPPHEADPREQPTASALVDHRHETEADRQLERVDLRARGRADRIGTASASAVFCFAVASSTAFCRPTVRPRSISIPPTKRNGSIGRPGTSPIAAITPPASSVARRLAEQLSR